VEFSQFDAVLNLLLFVLAISWVSRRLNIPDTVPLLLGGLIAISFPRYQIPIQSSEILAGIFLPPIIFDAALNLDTDALVKDLDVVFGLAVAGTVFTVSVVAGFAYFILGFAPVEALLLGIIISPTDPVAVLANYKRIGVNHRFRLLVEGESLFNDRVAIVAYALL